MKQFPQFNPEKVFKVDKKGIIYLNGVRINDKKLEQLQTEATIFKNSLLWSIITDSLNAQAQEIGWTKSKEIQDLMNGKMISYTISVQENIIKQIEHSKL